MFPLYMVVHTDNTHISRIHHTRPTSTNSCATTNTCCLHLRLLSQAQMPLMEHGRGTPGYHCCLTRPADHVLGWSEHSTPWERQELQLWTTLLKEHFQRCRNTMLLTLPIEACSGIHATVTHTASTQTWIELGDLRTIMWSISSKNE